MQHIALLHSVEAGQACDTLLSDLGASAAAVTQISPAALSEESPFDLVLATSSAHRKTTSHPTLLLLREALSVAIADDGFSNLCSFDGYLAQTEAAGLLRHLAVSLDKPLTEPVVVEGGDIVAAALRGLEAAQAAEAARSLAFGRREIDVILRTGNRSAAVVRRAVDSLRRQSAGSVRLILVRHGPLDLETGVGAPSGALKAVQVVEAPGANRGRALAAGLAAVRSDFFCVLDDDDYLLSSHFLGLLTAIDGSDAARRLAYCDVLKLREGASDPSGATPFSVLREGVGSGPITAILERFTSHCFMATRETLAPIRFNHWDLATAEDSLLVAALLRHAQPLHSPNATAIYCQGADGASSFTDHPQRRADEAALHAETFAWRAQIEARFLAEAAERLELLGPAVRRWEAPAEAAQRSSFVPLSDDQTAAPRMALGSAFVGGAFGGDDQVFVRVPLGLGRASGKSLYFEPDEGGIQIGPQPAWAIGFKVDVADYQMSGCAVRAVVVLRTAGTETALGLVDAGGALVERTLLAGSRQVGAAEVTGAVGTPVVAVVMQAGAQGADSCRVSELRLGYALTELAAAFGLDAQTDRGAILDRLGEALTRQVVGRPATPQTRAASIDYRGPQSLFRHAIEDGPFREGAQRRLGTGVKPWDYFAQIHLPSAALPDARWVRVDLAHTEEPFTVMLVDSRFTTRLSPSLHVYADKAQVELWLPAPDADAYLIFQSGAEPRDRPLVLVGVTLAGSAKLSPCGRR